MSQRIAGLPACPWPQRKMGTVKLVLALLLSALTLTAQSRYPVDWQKLEPEILERFSELLRIDTQNPPGNETKAANALKAILEREGIATKQFALDPARANLVA